MQERQKHHSMADKVTRYIYKYCPYVQFKNKKLFQLGIFHYIYLTAVEID